MRFSRLLTIASVVALLGLAGCGGGDDEPTTAANTTTEAERRLSKEELIRQGDAICAEVNAAVGTIGASTADEQTRTSQIARLYAGMAGNLENLGEPRETEGYAELIEAAEELAAVEGEVELAAEREDSEALSSASMRAAPALEAFQTQADAYGFQDCAEGPTTPATPGAGAGGEEATEGGVEAAPEAAPEVAPEEVAPEEAPQTGGAGGVEEAAPEGGGTGAGGGGGTSGGSSGGVGPG